VKLNQFKVLLIYFNYKTIRLSKGLTNAIYLRISPFCWLEGYILGMALALDQTLFALLRAIEIDAKECISQFLEPTIGLEEIVENFELKIQRRQKDEYNKEISPLECLDFGDYFEIFSTHKNKIPSDLKSDLDPLRSNLSSLVKLRNRVMHGRPLSNEDLENFYNITSSLQSVYWKNFIDAKRKIALNQLNVQISLENEDTQVFNNLPRPDFNDTGLIGRKQDLQKIISYIEDERTTILTLTGAGGVGKTSLALQVAYNLVESEKPIFDTILWVSLKTEYLGIEGIQQIKNAINNIGDAIGAIKGVLSKDDSADFADLLKNRRTLICLDNLETITGDDFVTQLYDKMPTTVKFLLTSRQGLGQLERRFDVNTLSETDALHLLNSVVRSLDVEVLEKTNLEIKKAIVNRYRCNPLAIKWFVQSAAAGIPIKQILDEKEIDFFDFCISSVLDSMSMSAKKIVLFIYLAKKSVTIEEILSLLVKQSSKIAITTDQIYLAIKELKTFALIRNEVIDSTLREKIYITESLQQYLNKIDYFNPNEIREMKKILDKLSTQSSDILNNDNESFFSPYYMSLRSADDIPIANMLKEALRQNRYQHNLALSTIKNLRNLSPDFWEVSRVEAFIRSFTDESSVVLGIYDQAIEKAPNPKELARVKYFLAQYLKKSNNPDSLASAYKIAKECYEIIPDYEILHLMGNLEVQLGDFEKAIENIKKSLFVKNTRSLLIHTTSLITSYRRYAEYKFVQEKNFGEALELLNQAFIEFEGAWIDGSRDYLLTETYSEIVRSVLIVLLKAKDMNLSIYRDYEKYFEKIAKFPEIIMADNKLGKKNIDMMIKLSEISESVKNYLVSNGMMETLISNSLNQKNLDQIEYRGQILTLFDGFGFIKHPSFASNIRFKAKQFADKNDFYKLQRGTVIYFSADSNEKLNKGEAATATGVRLA
jgi:tetratricopeptide (TPR) repeat protein